MVAQSISEQAICSPAKSMSTWLARSAGILALKIPSDT